MSTERDERVERLNKIRESRRSFYGGMGQLTADIDYLLSLLDTQAAEVIALRKEVAASERYQALLLDQPDATRMRDRCLEKVRAIRNAYGDGKNREYDYGFHRALDTVESALSHLENSDGRPTQS